MDSEKLTHIRDYIEGTLPNDGEHTYEFLEAERLMGGGGMAEEVSYIKLGIIELIDTVLETENKGEQNGSGI